VDANDRLTRLGDALIDRGGFSPEVRYHWIGPAAIGEDSVATPLGEWQRAWPRRSRPSRVSGASACVGSLLTRLGVGTRRFTCQSRCELS